MPTGTISELWLSEIKSELEGSMEKILYRKLKFTFYDWCSLLSLDECVSNPELIEAIERVERLLITAGEKS